MPSIPFQDLRTTSSRCTYKSLGNAALDDNASGDAAFGDVALGDGGLNGAALSDDALDDAVLETAQDDVMGSGDNSVTAVVNTNVQGLH